MSFQNKRCHNIVWVQQVSTSRLVVTQVQFQTMCIIFESISSTYSALDSQQSMIQTFLLHQFSSYWLQITLINKIRGTTT